MISTTRMLALALALAAATGCKKKEDAAATEPAPAPAAEPAAPATPPPAEPATPPPTETAAAATTGDTVRFLVPHQPSKDGDPVVVQVNAVTVVSSSYKDPADLTGGTATLEIDLTSLSSGNPTRDEDLKGKYFEVAKFPKATVVVKDVKKSGADAYKATADVDVHGVKGTVPVEFTVTEKGADSVRVKGTAKLSRMDYKVGTPNGKDNPTGESVTVELEATVKKG